MKERGKPFSDVEIRNWCFQIFRALAYMHHHGYFHRDLKPGTALIFSLKVYFMKVLFDAIEKLVGRHIFEVL